MFSKQRNRLLFQKRVLLPLYLTKISPNISKLCEGHWVHLSHWTGDHGMYRFIWIKFFKNTTLCLLYYAWVATTMCREWKEGDGTKRFENTGLDSNNVEALISVCFFLIIQRLIFCSGAAKGGRGAVRPWRHFYWAALWAMLLWVINLQRMYWNKSGLNVGTLLAVEAQFWFWVI